MPALHPPLYCLLRTHRELPAAHPPLYCRTAEELYLHLGASIGYWRGDIKGLMEDIGGQGQRGRLLGIIRAQRRLERTELSTFHCAGSRAAALLCLSAAVRPRCPPSNKSIVLSSASLPARPAGALRPTLFCGVPRVFDRIYAGVMQKARR